MKKFKLEANEIKKLVSGMGGCIATDMITVDGRKVHFMYREQPTNEMDSGWRFFSGYEDDNYLSDSRNSSVYDVNTIANYDSDIIEYLNVPHNSAFERNNDGVFVRVEDFDFE